MASHSISPSPLTNTKNFPNTTTTTTTFLSKLFIQPTQKQISIKAKRSYCSSSSTIPPLYIPNKIPNDKYIRILDTTLRDGEQAPGATMTTPQKLAIAHKLVKLRVDVIEAGFPAASKAEFEATQLIAKQIGNDTSEFGHVPVICAASRMVRKDIDTTWEAVRYAKHPRMNIFIPTSEIHMKYKLNKTKDEVLRIVEEMVSYTRSLGVMDITFISEDSARSEKEFLYQVFGEAIKAGATTVTFCDTVGCKLPNEWGQFIADMKANVPGVENVIISTHCHNDLGLATANTLAAVSSGARQVEVTLNGIGERAGNAPLEEFVMAIKCRGEDNLGGLHTGIDTKHIVTSSKMVEKYSGLSLQPHKPIVGVNSFAHGSGIHQDGVLKNKSTYEFISPEDIGLDRSNDNGIVLGKLSGRHALKTRLADLGYELDERNLDNIFWRFKTLAEKKKIISDNDLVLLVSDDKALQPKEPTWKLIDIQVSSSSNSLATANVKISDGGGQEHVASAVGTNSINAACKAIDLIAKVPVKIVECEMKMADEVLKGVASTRVILRKEENKTNSGPVIVSGTGSGDDIIIATAQAYVNALNKLLCVRNKIISVVS